MEILPDGSPGFLFDAGAPTEDERIEVAIHRSFTRSNYIKLSEFRKSRFSAANRPSMNAIKATFSRLHKEGRIVYKPDCKAYAKTPLW